MKKVILFIFSAVLLGMMSCEEAALEENSPIDFVTVSNDKGIVDSYEIDRESGALISSSTNSSSKSDGDGDVISGTVNRIVTHDDGNRTIYCTASQNVCYTEGIGPGPCADC